VLSVIIFHLSSALLPGGFIGVDVFFVISGFLISGHIFDEVSRGSFSLTGFYSRRIKRIAPAMLVVVAVTLVVAKLMMLPEDGAATSESGVWSLSSLANVFFWRNEDTSYFTAQGKDLPLLHLWSLGVEEQFYIVWPLLLMAAYRADRAKGFLIGMLITATASFALATLLFPRDPSFVFYMLPTRAGELLLGAVAANAVVARWWQSLSPRIVKASTAIAAGVLIVNFAIVSEYAPFPGILAVPPTAATAVLLLAGRNAESWTARALSLRPLVAIGLVSYSAYLWHWPLITFYRYAHFDIGLVAGLCLFAITMCLAWASYRFIEQPARRSKLAFGQLLTRQYIVPAGVIGVFALGVIYADRLWPQLQHTEYRRQLAVLRDRSRPAYAYPYVCQRQKLEIADVTDPRCVLGPSSTVLPDSEPSILLWGDSNATHYIGILGVFAREAGFRFRNVEVGACPPLLSSPSDFIDARRERDCVASLALIRPLLDRTSIVVISAEWTTYQGRSPAFFDRLSETVRTLTGQGKQVILLGKAPIFPRFDRRCREKALGIPFLECPVIRSPLPAHVVQMNAAIQRLASELTNVAYFDANAYLCAKDGVCATHADDGELLFYDRGHLSMPGSWSLGEFIVRGAGVPDPFRRLAMTGAPPGHGAR
jgi:peptidoglycan/LPS O-acetylase OafA/YrhL